MQKAFPQQQPAMAQQEKISDFFLLIRLQIFHSLDEAQKYQQPHESTFAFSRKYRNGQRLNYDIFILRYIFKQFNETSIKEFSVFTSFYSLQKCRKHRHRRYDKSKECKNVLRREIIKRFLNLRIDLFMIFQFSFSSSDNKLIAVETFAIFLPSQKRNKTFCQTNVNRNHSCKANRPVVRCDIVPVLS